MEIPAVFSMESISIAATSAPKALPVVGNIIRLSSEIRETSERVQINQHQCEQLSERIDTLIGFLADRDFSSDSYEPLHKALNRFEAFLLECLEFITTFTETTWFKRIVNNKDHEKKFLDLNRELTQYSNDINFGIGLSNMSTNNHKDGNKQDHIESNKSDERETKNREKTAVKTNWENARGVQEIPNTDSESVPPYAQPTHNTSIFISGTWNYFYYQYNQRFGPFQHHITFNHTSGELSGYGQDSVGKYKLYGTFSEETGQMEMTQQYQVGTGNLALNFGQQGVVQLRWSKSRNIFKGTGYTNVRGQLVPDAIIEMLHA